MALKPIAYVQASWHADIIDHCRNAFMAEITTHGYSGGRGAGRQPPWP